MKRRLADLFEHGCIAVNRQRGNANEISVHLPSDIRTCRQLIDLEEQEERVELQEKDERDYYTDPGRRLIVLARDQHACVYCTAALSEKNFVLDHLLPVAMGGTNRRYNLVASCEDCNGRRGESDPVDFLRKNYREQLLTQQEFLKQKDYVETLLAENNG